MKQPDLEAKKKYLDIVNDAPTIVLIGKRKFKIRWLKPYTLERLTKVWIERDLASANIDDAKNTTKDMLKEPYFAFKEAALMLLNHDIKIRLFYPILWRWLAHKYSETQIVRIVFEGKKKLPVMAHFETMAYSMDMRTDVMKMTKMEAEQYQAELQSVARQLSSKTSPLMAALVGASLSGNGTSDIGAF